MDSFDFRSIIRPLLKWWWLLLTASLLAGLSSVVYLVQQPSTYESRTSLMVGSFIQNPNPSGQEFYLNQQLAETYAGFVYRGVVRDATMQSLGMNWLPAYSAFAQGQLLEIAVTDTDPQRAQAVAQELANQVILQGPAGRAGGERQAFVEQRLQKLEADISATEAEMERKQIEMANELSASKIRRLETDLSTLASKVNALQTSYSELYSTSLGGAANTIYIFEPAGLPTGTLSKGYLVYALAAMVFGLVLAGAGAYVLEYQDDSIKSAAQIREILELPTLGAIPTFADGPKSGGSPVIMMENSLQPMAEAYRVLRTNLQFASVDRKLHLLQITSPSPGEGKSVTAANLSAALAHGGLRTILVDADFRRPTQHKLFNLTNNYGLTLALLGRFDSIDQLLHKTPVPNLRVLTAGPLPPNPSELLSSKKMQEMLAILRKEADIVVIDSPPVTVVSDTAIIAGHADGVLLVMRSGHTREEYAERSLRILRQVDARVLGAILNSAPVKNGGYDYDYGHQYGYSYGYTGGATNAFTRRRKRNKGTGTPAAPAVRLEPQRGTVQAVNGEVQKTPQSIVDPEKDAVR